MPRGRPKGSGDTYTESMALAICDEIARGVPLTVVTERLGLKYRTVVDWRLAHPEFAALIASARDDAVERMFWETKQIADEQEVGEITEEGDGPKGSFSKTRRADMIEHRKLKVYTRMQIAARHNPKKYGGRAEKEGDDPGQGTEVVVRGGLPDG